MVFGIGKKRFERGLSDLYGQVVAYVNETLKPFSEKDQELEGTVNDLEKRLEQAKERSEQADVERTKHDDTLERLNDQLAEYGKRLSELEESQQKTGIVSEAVRPKGKVTFEDVQGLAKEVSDTAYERIRDYFLLEMAKKGYEGERPDFSIWDRDSALGIRFLVTDEQQKPHAGWNTGQKHKTRAYLENIPKLEEGTARWGGKVKVLFSREGFDNYRDWFLLEVNSNRGDWGQKLREELPELLQAYMLGYSLKCLDEESYDSALEIQKKYDLRDNSALLARMSEIMPSDPNLATAFVAQYSSAE